MVAPRAFGVSHRVADPLPSGRSGRPRSSVAGVAVSAGGEMYVHPAMGETVDFESDGDTASGYLVTPPAGSGPGVLVMQEWWGLDPGIKQSAERIAADGFVVLVPDLYHGELAGHDEMDKAAQLMQSLPPERAARDMNAAVDYLAAHPAVTSRGLGVVGFCMGGMLAARDRREPRRPDQGGRSLLRVSAG